MNIENPQIFFKDRNEFHRLWRIQYGICLPSTCMAPEISKGLNHSLNGKDVFSLNLEQENCWTKKARKIEDTGWITM